MIKKIGLPAIMLFVSLLPVIAQTVFTGKPQYQIAAKRAGIFLGNIDIELFPTIAPKHTANFDSLVAVSFFDSTAFHRVIPGFMIQGGDPNSRSGPKSTWGYGNPNQATVPAEFTAAKHLRGRLSAARDADTNSANSQFFICVAPASWLDGQYSVYGQVTAGMNWVDTIVNEPRDANDCPYKKIEMFITYTGSNDSIPASPALISPADSAMNIPGSQLLEWSAISDAVLYKLEVSTDSTFGSFFFSEEVAGTTRTLNNLEGLKTYYWRIKANNGGNYSAYSARRQFTTQTGAATLINPLHASTDVPLDPVFVWNQVPGANFYRLQVAKSSSFSSSVLVHDEPGITDTTAQVTGLLPNTSYYWRVRSAIDTSEGSYSIKWAFRTTAATSSDELRERNNELNILASPNPFTGTAIISYTLSKAEKVIIKVYDILGKELKTVLNEYRPAGDHLLKLSMEKYSPGIYFYKTEAGEKSVIKKLILAY